MYAGRTPQDLVVELERRLDTMEDFHADTRLMGIAVEGADELIADQDSWRKNGDALHKVELGIDLKGEESWWGEMNAFSQTQVAQRLDIPRKYWDRMRDNHPDLLQDAVTTLFAREPEVRLVRTLDGGVRAFLSNAYRCRDNYDLMDKAILPAIKKARMQIVSCDLTEYRMYIKVLFPDVQEEVKKGDIVQAGIVITNSEVGAGSTAVEPFLYRLICTNGMIAPIHFSEFGLRKHHVGRRIGGRADVEQSTHSLFSERTVQLDDAAFQAMVYDIVKGSINGVAFALMVDKLKDLMVLPTTGDPVAVVERIARNERLSEGERTSIMRHFIDGGDQTAYGYVNAVTRTAEDADGYDRATELERLGGQMMDWSDKAWKELLGTSERVERRVRQPRQSRRSRVASDTSAETAEVE